jgi:hypothetical protein
MGDATGRFSTRWVEGKKPKRTTTERSPMIPTERLVVASTTKRDAEHFDAVIAACHPLKPPGRKR